MGEQLAPRGREPVLYEKMEEGPQSGETAGSLTGLWGWREGGIWRHPRQITQPIILPPIGPQ